MGFNLLEVAPFAARRHFPKTYEEEVSKRPISSSACGVLTWLGRGQVAAVWQER